jgi:hypothetical protein
MQPNKLNLQVDDDFLASRNSPIARTSISSSTQINVRVEDDGQKKERIGEALQNIEPMDTLSPLKFQ